MDSLDIKYIAEGLMNQNTQMMELLNEQFTQKLIQKFDKLLQRLEASKGKPLTIKDKQDAFKDLAEREFKELGVYTDKLGKVIRELTKDIEQWAKVNQVSSSSTLYGVGMARRTNELIASGQENVINFNSAQAKSSSDANDLKKKFSNEIGKRIDISLDKVSEKLKSFLGNPLDPKKTKNFIANLVTAFAQNKAIAGVFEDLLKLVSLFGASFLAQFGTIGKLVGAGLVMFLPALAPVLLGVLGKFASTLIGGLVGALSPYLAPLLVIGAAVGGLYWLFNTEKGKNELGKNGILTSTDENGRPTQKFSPGLLNFHGGDGTNDYNNLAGYRYDYEYNNRKKDYYPKLRRKSLSEEDWQKAIGVKNFAFDTNTGMISNSARMASENLADAWTNFYNTMPEYYSKTYENVDIGNEALRDLFTKDSFKYSAVNRYNLRGEENSNPDSWLAGKGMTENLLALNDLNKAIGASVHVYEGGVQTAGSYTKKDFNPYDLRGGRRSLNAQNALSLLLGDFELNGKKVGVRDYQKAVINYLSEKSDRTQGEENLLRMFMGGFVNQEGGKAIISDRHYTGEGESYFQATSKIASDSGIGFDEVLEQQKKLSQEAQSSSSDIYKIPELPKENVNISDYDGKEIQSSQYPLPGTLKNVQQINVDTNNMEEVSPPKNYKKASAEGIDVMGNAEFSKVFMAANRISLWGTDFANGGGTIG